MKRTVQALSLLSVGEEATSAVSATQSDNGAREFVVTTARTVQEGLNQLAEHDFDCIVSGYDLPDASGIELHERVRETNETIPFILVTDAEREGVARDALAAGVTDYLQTHPDADGLLAQKITTAVETWRENQRDSRRAEAMEATSAALAIIDDAGQYLDVNPAYAEQYRTEMRTLVGTPFADTVPNDETHIDAVFDALEEQGGWSGVLDGERADGTRFSRFVSLRPLPRAGYVCVEFFLSEHQRTSETTTGEIRAKLDLLFEHSPDMINVHDSKGRLVDTNTRLCDALGYTREELLGMYVWDIDANIGPSDALEFWEDMAPGETKHVEAVFERRDGSTFPADVHLSKVAIDGESLFLVISRDVSTQKEYEEQLEREKDRLEEFASIVSHDLRNPLTVAMGRTQLAREECESENLDAVVRAHERMEELISNLLELSKQGATVATFESVLLCDLVAQAWETIDTAEATLVCETESAILADADRLRQLFENLIGNAVDHGGSNVTVTIGDLPGGSGFYLEDDGPGITADEQRRAFDFGYSTRPGGTGFGLYIVQQIAEAHGWMVRLTSGSAGGARFEFRDVELVEER